MSEFGIRGTDIQVSFHSSGSTSQQWRKLKNLWFPGRTLFRPKGFLDQGAGPTCISSLSEAGCSHRVVAERSRAHQLGYVYDGDEPRRGAVPRARSLRSSSDFLPSLDQDLLSIYGQYRSSLVDHMDVDQAHSLEPQELERSLFHFHLASEYLSFVCSHLSRSPSDEAWKKESEVGLDNIHTSSLASENPKAYGAQEKERTSGSPLMPSPDLKDPSGIRIERPETEITAGQSHYCLSPPKKLKTFFCLFLEGGHHQIRLRECPGIRFHSSFSLKGSRISLKPDPA